MMDRKNEEISPVQQTSGEQNENKDAASAAEVKNVAKFNDADDYDQETPPSRSTVESDRDEKDLAETTKNKEPEIDERVQEEIETHRDNLRSTIVTYIMKFLKKCCRCEDDEVAGDLIDKGQRGGE